MSWSSKSIQWPAVANQTSAPPHALRPTPSTKEKLSLRPIDCQSCKLNKGRKRQPPLRWSCCFAKISLATPNAYLSSGRKRLPSLRVTVRASQFLTLQNRQLIKIAGLRAWLSMWSESEQWEITLHAVQTRNTKQAVCWLAVDSPSGVPWGSSEHKLIRGKSTLTAPGLTLIKQTLSEYSSNHSMYVFIQSRARIRSLKPLFDWALASGRQLKVTTIASATWTKWVPSVKWKRFRAGIKTSMVDSNSTTVFFCRTALITLIVTGLRSTLSWRRSL